MRDRECKSDNSDNSSPIQQNYHSENQLLHITWEYFWYCVGNKIIYVAQINSFYYFEQFSEFNKCDGIRSKIFWDWLNENIQWYFLFTYKMMVFF